MNRERLLLIFIIVFYICNGLYSIHAWSVTSDEGSHLDYAKRLLQNKTDRVFPEKDNSKMPISILNAMPRAVEQVLNPGLKKSDNGISDITNGRCITLFFSIATILLVFVWARKLYGAKAGLLAAFLMSICPNNLAAAVLVTTDAYASFFLLATMYTLWKYCTEKTLKNFVLFAFTLAFAQLAKQSLFHLYIVCSILFFVYSWRTGQKLDWKKLATNFTFIFFINWLVINSGFLFSKTFMPLGNFTFSSQLFLQLQQLLPSWLPVPFAEAFITGLDMAKYYDQLGGGLTGNPESSFANVTILNQSSTGGNFWYYYFVSVFYKTPITYFVLIGLAIYVSFKKKLVSSFTQIEWFLILPVIYYLLLMSFMYKTQCGIRHIIFIYPLLFVYCGSAVHLFNSTKVKIVLTAQLIYLVGSVLFYYKNYYAYTNEFCYNKLAAYKKVGASNINFNQGFKALNKYLAENPTVKYAPQAPAKGVFVVMLDEYMDIWNTGKYKWLQQYEPVASVAEGCFLVFNISETK
jgi:Dolichyl-phosphate-mannose-protein mannosyltransferase